MEHRAREHLCDFCRLTGRKLVDAEADVQRIADAYTLYVNLAGITTSAPSAILIDDGSYSAFNLTGDWSGVIIDRRAVDGLGRIAHALVNGEHGVDIAAPMVKIVADILQRGGKPGAALMLRHERLSELYALDEAETGLRLLKDCSAFLDRIEGLKSIPEDGWRTIAAGYLVMHEIGHWVFNEHGHEGALAKVVAGVRESVDKVRNIPLGPRLQAAGLKAGDDILKIGAIGERNLVEEVFCDRLTAGAFYARSASDEVSWQTCFTLLRCLHESKRLLLRARHRPSLHRRTGQYARDADPDRERIHAGVLSDALESVSVFSGPARFSAPHFSGFWPRNRAAPGRAFERQRRVDVAVFAGLHEMRGANGRTNIVALTARGRRQGEGHRRRGVL